MSKSVTFFRRGESCKFYAALVLTMLSLALFSGSSEASQNTMKKSRKAPVKITRVKASKVCMVNNTVFPKDQIPIKVNGRTYYGCCEMCKGRLGHDEQVRRAIDPVSKKPVDKAQAIIGAKPDGTVLYFESEKTLQKYNASAGVNER